VIIEFIFIWLNSLKMLSAENQFFSLKCSFYCPILLPLGPCQPERPNDWSTPPPAISLVISTGKEIVA
jgi:hypothetical protein